MVRTANYFLATLPISNISFSSLKDIAESLSVMLFVVHSLGLSTEAELQEGYQATASVNRQLSELALPIALETWPNWEP